jgi:hypothetical protein
MSCQVPFFGSTQRAVARARYAIEAKRYDFSIARAEQQGIAGGAWAAMLAIRAEATGVPKTTARYKQLEQRAREHKAIYDAAQIKLAKINQYDKLLAQRLESMTTDIDQSDVTDLLDQTSTLVPAVRPSVERVLNVLENAKDVDLDAATDRAEIDGAMNDALGAFAAEADLNKAQQAAATSSAGGGGESIFDDIDALLPAGVDAPTPVPAPMPSLPHVPRGEPSRPMARQMDSGAAARRPTARAPAKPLLATEF